MMMMMVKAIMDNGSRRSGIDRRQIEYSAHVPERRSSEDRRKLSDRRSGGDRRSCDERRESCLLSPKVLDLRCSQDRRVLGERRAAFA